MDSKFWYLFIIGTIPLTSHANESSGPPPLGNFAVPNSQQPGPLISFGENILDKGETQIFLYADDYVGKNQYTVNVVPGVIYGITDYLSIFVNVPYTPSQKSGPDKSSGIEDVFAQLEYAFYNHSTHDFVDQATIVANISAPTGSIYKNPPTGYGSPSFFLGGTYNRTCQNWFVFGSPGVVFTTAKNGTKYGNSYLYQFGFGRNITNTKSWVFAWMAEFDGTYTQRDRYRGLIDQSSGGNNIYLAPSFWASNKYVIVQLAVGFPITQSFNGSQPRGNYLLAANVGWSFY